MAAELENVEFKSPTVPVIQNTHGRVVKAPEDIKANLLKQLYMPVQWVDSIVCMRDLGIGHIVECGPGKVLGGLIKRIASDIECYSTEEIESFKNALEMH